MTSEAQVVYILVETRKLLERDRCLDNFKALKLRADWAVHPKLRGPQAQEILRYFDRYELENQQSGITVAEYDFDPLHDFMAHTTFRQELVDSLGPYGVTVQRFMEDGFWQPFIEHYTSVIQDCALEAVEDNPTQFVTHVYGTALPGMSVLYPGKRVIQWDWTIRNQQASKFVWTLI